MATPLPLEGDGLVENLFHYLWTTDDLGGGPRVSVPPTVIYRGTQPTAWYFTSRKSGRIKRKHRANLTAAHIEHSFSKRKATTDIVAYYLYLPKAESTSPAIEYFDIEALRDFLFKRPDIPHSSSPGSLQSTGILQQFSLPKGARNSTLRAIWSPKLCLLERRVNMHAIHDARFSVYERGVTFEEGGGAEALSRPEPVRGSMLPGMVQQVCERVVDHVTRVSYHKFRIARMVLRLQLDSDDRLWLLWSSSLRLQPPLGPSTIMIAPDMPTGETSIRPLDIVSDAKVPTFAFAQGSGGGTVSLSSSSCPEVDEEPRPGQMRCASCAQVVAHRALLPTTYKAVLAHFHHVLKFLRERVNEENQVSIEWPPDERVVQQAGGVGFGILRYLKSVSSSSDDTSLPKASSAMKLWQGRELLVPPVIRYIHPTLRAEDFARHRQDPIFLHKTVGVCERCCLVYADYATASLEANGLGIRTSASAPALLRPVREIPRHAEYFDDPPDSLLLITTNSGSPLMRGACTTMSKTKPPASAWKPVPTDERRSEKFKAGPRSTLNSLPIAPKLPPRIESFESGDNDALRMPDGIHDGSPELQQREEAFFRELYQQKDTAKRGGHALRHILEAADRLSKAKPQHRLAALGDSTQIGQSQSTGALMGAITELKLTKKPGKSPYSVVQRIRGDGGIVNLPKNQSTSPPAKSTEKHQVKKKMKKRRGQGGGSPKKMRFVSSREKRAAAEHRGYLVAALSDAQVQLEHIESLATLVISARDIEADPVEIDTKGQQQRQKKKIDKERPSSPQEDSIVDQEPEGDQGHEDDHAQLGSDDKNDHEDDLTDEEDKPTENEAGGMNEAPESPDHRDAEDEPLDRPQLVDTETEEKQPEQNHGVVDESEIQNQELDEAQSNGLVQQHEKDNAIDDEAEGGNEMLEGFENETLNADQPLLQEAETEPHLRNHGEDKASEVQNQELVAQQRTGEEQLQSEEVLLEQEYNETKLEDQELDSFTTDGQQQTREHEEPLEQNDGQIQQQEAEIELELRQLQEQGQEDEDDYNDEYEDPDHEQEQCDQDDQHTEKFDKKDDIEAQGEVEPTENLLDQAHELLAAAESVDASEDHEVIRDHDVSNDDSNDQSILTPLLPLENDSSDDGVMAADSAIAAALPLPSSDEWTNAASDE